MVKVVITHFTFVLFIFFMKWFNMSLQIWFSSKAHMCFQTHIASVHENKKPFTCEIWSISFARKPNLQSKYRNWNEFLLVIKSTALAEVQVIVFHLYFWTKWFTTEEEWTNFGFKIKLKKQKEVIDSATFTTFQIGT